MSVKIIKNYRDYRDQQESVKERKECMPEEDNFETKGQEGQEEPTQEKEPTEESNKGKLLVDAKCALADITYPTDAGRPNNAREKTEKIKDTVCFGGGLAGCGSLGQALSVALVSFLRAIGSENGIDLLLEL